MLVHRGTVDINRRTIGEQMFKNTNVNSDNVVIDLNDLFRNSSIVSDGTGDPLGSEQIVQDFILDYCANTDGISDELTNAYLVFRQDLADELSMKAFLEEKAQEVTEGTECQNWDSSEECRDDSCLHHRILDTSEILTEDVHDEYHDEELVLFANLPMLARF